VLRKVQGLRNQSLSYQKIADILNTMNIPTKSKKAKWYSKTVMTLIKGAGSS
jgi:hypothetical protein